MKYRMLCLAFSSLSLFGHMSKEAIRSKNPSKVQIVFEVEKDPDVDQQIWDYVLDRLLELYTPSLSSDEELDEWTTRFNNLMKKISYISSKTKKAHGRLTFRFVTD